MEVSEYIEAVISQMRYKRARGMVAKELTDHIEDQMQDYLEEGMSLAEAKAEAVRQMGDAIEVGTAMDAIHRPRMDKRTLILIGIFSVAACFLQTIIVFAQRGNGNQFVSQRMVPFQVLLGVIVMVVILYSDYTMLAKRPVMLWAGLYIFLPIILNSLFGNVGMVNMSGSVAERFMLCLTLALAPPVYAAVVNCYRSKGWRGLAAGILWLLAAVPFVRSCGVSVYALLMMTVICLAVLSKAVAKGWYGISPFKGLAALWGVFAGAVLGVVGCLFAFGKDYQQLRLQALLQFFDKDAQIEANYMTLNMSASLNKLSLWGRGSGWEPEGVMELTGDMSFYILLNRIGLIPGILIILGLIILLSGMVAGISKQKNVLGSLVGTSCFLGLLMPAIWHVAANLSFVPFGQMVIPFLYPGWIANIVSYTMLGFYLSVYRNTDVVA